MRSTVVLPEPDGPSIEKNSPVAMLRFASSTATTGGLPPNSLRRPSRRMAGGDVPGLASIVGDEDMSLLGRRSGTKTYGPICLAARPLSRSLPEPAPPVISSVGPRRKGVDVADSSLGIGTYAAVFAPLETAGRAEVITRRLSDAISLGVLPDGLLLPAETELAERLGVATVTVREALGTLREAGMIRTRRGRHGGSFVCSPDDGGRAALLDRLRGLGQGELRDVGDHYAAIGGACAVLASQRADAGDVARLTALAPVGGEGRAASEGLRAGGDFHLEVA